MCGLDQLKCSFIHIYSLFPDYSFAFPILFLLLTVFPSFSQSQNFTEKTRTNNFQVTGQNRGIAIGDFDQDGWEDIYISRLDGLNLLYKNLGNFQFEEVGFQYGVSHPAQTACSLWFDMDNDGDLDLFLGNVFQYNVLYRNDGEEFTNITHTAGIATKGNPRSVNAVDYDNDGDLDVYVAQILEENIMWRNEGDGTFTDVTASTGLTDKGRSLGALFFDYDLDGDPDLYQANDGIDPNLFWRNNGDGTFTEISEEVGVHEVFCGMGIDVADLNGDQFPDLYVTNLEENRLYLSTPAGVFEEVAKQVGVDDRGMGWSTFFFDCNNDGLSDIYLANDTYFKVYGQSFSNRLYVNKGNLEFVSGSYAGNIQNVYGSFGAATADFDQDGRWDIVITNNGKTDGNQLFQNTSQAGNYLTIRLKGVLSNSQGIGAWAELFVGENRQVDFIQGGSGYVSQSSPRIHFGLGTHTEVDSVVVHWPSGIIQTLRNPPINRLLTLEEGGENPIILTHNQALIPNISLQLYPNPVQRGGVISVFIDENPPVLQAELVSVWGNVISLNGAVSSSLDLNIPTYISPGVYLLKLKGSKHTYVGKLIVL